MSATAATARLEARISTDLHAMLKRAAGVVGPVAGVAHHPPHQPQVGPAHKLAALVHYLDVGGVQPAEATGVERILAGLRGAITEDDRLLDAARGIFDGLLAAYEHEINESTTGRSP